MSARGKPVSGKKKEYGSEDEVVDLDGPDDLAIGQVQVLDFGCHGDSRWERVLFDQVAIRIRCK